MKNLVLLSSVLILMASCGSNTNEESAKVEMSMEEATDGKVIDYTKMDPVCEMEWEQGWTESTVYLGDTIRFCSENCKTAFIARPEKYIASGE